MQYNVKEISQLLDFHPYYTKLTSNQKLIVLNVALSNYWELQEDDIYAGIIPNGSIGYQLTVDNGVIKKMTNDDIIGYALSSYKIKDLDLSGNEYLSQLSNEQKYIIYTIAIEKIAYENDDYLFDSAVTNLDFNINLDFIYDINYTINNLIVHRPESTTTTNLIEYTRPIITISKMNMNKYIEYSKDIIYNKPSITQTNEINYTIGSYPKIYPELTKLIEYHVYKTGEVEMETSINLDFDSYVSYSIN